MKTLIKKLSSLRPKKKRESVHSRIFDCRDIDYITGISHTYSYHGKRAGVEYQFQVFFKSGFRLVFSQTIPCAHEEADQYNCPELIDIRELFINNFGFSSFKLEELHGITIYKI